MAALAAWEYPAELLTPAQALQLEPDLVIPSDVRQIAYFPDEAYLLTVPAIQTLLRYSAERDANLITGDPVVEVLVSCNRVSGVRLASGEVIEAVTVVYCAGWRTPSLAAQIGADVPLVLVDAPGSSAPCLVA